MKYYTADLHFFHPGLAEARGFGSLEEMNEAMVKKLAFLKRDDDLYILGDIAYGYTLEHDLDEVVSLLKRIGCRKHLVVGNHDAWALKHLRGMDGFRRQFRSIEEHMLLTDGGSDLYLSHYPMVEWDGYYKGRWLFYGHIHDRPTSGPGLLMGLVPTAVNVGIDLLGRPMTAEEIMAKRKKGWRAEGICLANVILPKVDPSLLNGKKGITSELQQFAGIRILQEGQGPDPLSCPEKTKALDMA